MKTEFPTIQIGVPGPDGRPGFLLIVPRDEALEWDIRDEIVSTSRYWVPDRQAWWIAAPYLPTAQEIVRRFAPPAVAPPPPPPPPLPPPPLPPEPTEEARPAGWRGLAGALRAALRRLGAGRWA